LKVLWKTTQSNKPIVRHRPKRFSFRPNIKPRIKIDKRSAGRFRRKLTIFTPLLRIIKSNFQYVLIVFSLLIIGLFFYGIFQTNVFDVKKIRIEGVENVDRERLAEVVGKYKDRNIYSINLSDIEDEVLNSSVYIKNVYARKQLPSTIIIEIKERYPTLVILNFDGVYLIDAENIVTSNPINQSIDFSEDEWYVYHTNSLDNLIIKNRIMANLKEGDPEFDEESFDYENYDVTIKQRIKNEIKQEMDQAIAAHFSSLEQVVNESEYAGLPRVYFYDGGSYNQEDRLVLDQITDVEKVVKYFERLDRYSITKIAWVTKFSLKVETLEGKIFMFGDNRDIDKQIDDLDVILVELSLSGKDFTTINLQSEIIGVK